MDELELGMSVDEEEEAEDVSDELDVERKEVDDAVDPLVAAVIDAELGSLDDRMDDVTLDGGSEIESNEVAVLMFGIETVDEEPGKHLEGSAAMASVTEVRLK